MSTTLSALTYLYSFERGLPIPNGLAFEPQLQKCRLDYSVASLGRIDQLLDWLRRGKKMTWQGMIDDPAQQNLIYLLNFYVGEVIARHLQWPATWYDYEAAKEMDPLADYNGQAFENSATLGFPGRPVPTKLQWFRPLNAICSRIFPERYMEGVDEGEEIEPDKSVAFSAGLMLPPELFQGDNATRVLPPVSPPSWPLDFAGRLRQDPDLLEQVTPEPPDWLTPADGLSRMFDLSAELLQGGRVVPGLIVMANQGLFVPGAGAGAPGDVLYDPRGLLDFDGLIVVHRAVLSFMDKKSVDNDEERPLFDHFQDEMTRVFGLVLPASIIPYPISISTVYLERRNLPSRYIAGHVVPLLIKDSAPGVALPLPARFWSEQWLDDWHAVEARDNAQARAEGKTIPYVPDPELTHARAVSVTEEGLLWMRQKEYDRARLAWHRAAIAGNAGARFGLAELYEKGLGVERDLDKARKYYELAAAQNYERAIAALDRLNGKPARQESGNGIVAGAEIDVAAILNQRLAAAGFAPNQGAKPGDADKEALLNQRLAAAGIDLAGMAGDKQRRAAINDRKKRFRLGVGTLVGGVVVLGISYGFGKQGGPAPVVPYLIATGLIIAGVVMLVRWRMRAD